MAKKSSALSKVVKVSSVLAEILGKSELPRNQIGGLLWKYIKDNNLQDKDKKRIINPNDRLARILGNNPVDMFQMTKLVNKHIFKIEEEK